MKRQVDEAARTYNQSRHSALVAGPSDGEKLLWSCSFSHIVHLALRGSNAAEHSDEGAHLLL